MYSTVLSTYFNLSVSSASTACIILGVGAAYFWAVRGSKKVAYLSLITPLGELISAAIKNPGQHHSVLDFMKSNYLALVGAFSLLALSFLVANVLFGTFFVIACVSKGKRVRAYADFLGRGVPGIDSRYKDLEVQIEQLKSGDLAQRKRTIELLTAMADVNQYLDGFEQSGDRQEAKLRETLILILDRYLGVLFGREKKIRASLYLKDATIAGQPEVLKHFCSMPLQRASLPDCYEPSLAVDQSTAGECFRSGKVMVFPKDKKAKKVFRKSIQDSFTKSFVCMPVNYDFKRWGVLTLDTDQSEFPKIDEVGMVFLPILGYYLGYTISKSQMGGYATHEVRARC